MPEDIFFHLPSYFPCLHYSAMTLFRTTLEYLSPIADRVRAVSLFCCCSSVPSSLYSLSHLYSVSSLPLLVLHPSIHPLFFPLCLPIGALSCSSYPPVVLRSLFLDFIAPSLQSRADIGHEVREMGSHAPAVSRLKWA